MKASHLLLNLKLMKGNSEMKRRIVLALAMLLSVGALSLSSPQSVCAFGFCDNCIMQCYQESVTIYYQCRTNGGSVEQCHAQENQYYCNCNTMFCGGCERPSVCGPIN